MRIAGVRVDDITWNELVERVENAINEMKKITIGYLNIHVWNMARIHEEVRSFLEHADIVYCDGKGIQIGARLLGLNIRERYTGAFFIEDLAEIVAEQGWKIFVVGGREGVAEKACESLKERFPSFNCAGTHHGYIGGMEGKVVEAINRAGADIVFVGMGTPRQEEFVLQYRDGIDAPVVWCVGALFDYVAGVQKRAPRWMSEAGLEWFFRLITDPARLWRRYLIGNTKFFVKIFLEKLGK